MAAGRSEGKVSGGKVPGGEEEEEEEGWIERERAEGMNDFTRPVSISQSSSS